jgi:hypothetical protein
MPSETKKGLRPPVEPGPVNIDYAADDSCEIRCWCRGHVAPEVFRTECEVALLKWDERVIDLSRAEVAHQTWRTVRAPAELAAYGVCEFIHVESGPGRGAYPVTVLSNWLPLRADEPGTAIPWLVPETEASR